MLEPVIARHPEILGMPEDEITVCTNCCTKGVTVKEIKEALPLPRLQMGSCSNKQMTICQIGNLKLPLTTVLILSVVCSQNLIQYLPIEALLSLI